MSNSFKIKKPKIKAKDADKTKDIKEAKHGAKFMKNSREKGTISSNFSGKGSKDFSRKKT